MNEPEQDQQPPQGAGSAPSTPAPESDAETEVIQADLDRFRDLAMRTQADFENYRKRSAREREDAIRYANVSLLEKLVPILDSFELGIEAARQHSAESPIVGGMEMVRKQLHDLFSAHGVEVIDAVGQKFDPHIHEAVAQEASAAVEEGHVTRQLRKGYRLKDRLIRPANVMVSKGKPA